ncbi:hypothetical protein NPIL_187311 [Nephila pilipes]|uniref:Uncharacterized protein n=1 Tax=Nephila pilipes TaxID=299642 RepID=A0A8X6QA46_NEPPI|nr:hypothetical protein NPIL_187311 [Nephila pilipes]
MVPEACPFSAHGALVRVAGRLSFRDSSTVSGILRGSALGRMSTASRSWAVLGSYYLPRWFYPIADPFPQDSRSPQSRVCARSQPYVVIAGWTWKSLSASDTLFAGLAHRGGTFGCDDWRPVSHILVNKWAFSHQPSKSPWVISLHGSPKGGGRCWQATLQTLKKGLSQPEVWD